MTSVVDLSSVGVLRHPRWLLADVSWCINEGERWVVMGPNGAGKTTLLQILAARLHPTRGEVRLLGEELGAVDVADLRQSIGWASGSLADSLPAHERVIDVVVTGAWAVTGRWREQYEDHDLVRAQQLLVSWGLGSLADRTFGTLSEGERKRALIARSLMSDPELLLLDEPAAGLDVGGRESLVGALSRLACDDAAPTTVMVTHHLEEIPEGFTHALLMREGRVVAAGPIAEVLVDDRVSEVFSLPLVVSSDGRLGHGRTRWSARLADVTGG